MMIIIIIIMIMVVMMMMMMMMIIIVIIIIIMIMIIVILIITKTIIAFKGAIRDFDNLLTAPRTVSSTYAQVALAQSSANLVQHMERLSRATCVTCHVVRRDSSALRRPIRIPNDKESILCSFNGEELLLVFSALVSSPDAVVVVCWLLNVPATC